MRPIPLLKARLLLGVLAMPVALAVVWGKSADLLAWGLILCLVLSRWIEGIQASYQAALYTLGDFRTPNLLEITRRLVRVGSVGLVVWLDLGIEWAALAMLVTAILSGSQLARVTRRFLRIDFHGKLTDSWTDAAWFWANGVLFWLNAELSVLILSDLTSDTVTGIFAAATRLTGLFLIIPRTVNTTIIPRLFRSAKTGVGLDRQLSGSSLFLSAIGALVLVEGYFTGEPLIGLIYGSGYQASVSVFQLSCAFLFLNFVRVPASWYLSTSDRVRMVTIAMGLGAVVNVGACFLLVPSLGADGAAWASIVSEAALGLFCVASTTYFLGPRMFWSILAGTSFGCIFGLLHWLLADHLPWVVAASLVSGAGVLALGLAARKILRGWNPGGLFGVDSPGTGG